MLSPTPSNAESTRRVSSLSAVAFALKDANRFRSALVLKMHDTTTYGTYMANTMGVDWRRNMRVMDLPTANQTEALRTVTRDRCFDLIIATFELHHLDAIEAPYFANEVGASLAPGGAFLVADYTLPDIRTDECGLFITTDNERLNALSYGGAENWYKAHSGWTADRLKDMAACTGATHAMSEAIPGHAALAAASDDPAVIERAMEAARRFRQV